MLTGSTYLAAENEALRTQIERLRAESVAAERERCARIAEAYSEIHGKAIAAAIRRGEP